MNQALVQALLGSPGGGGGGGGDGRIYGVAVGVVTNNKDPLELGRVKVRLPWLSDEDESQWARLATLMAGADRGTFFLPEVDDEVLVAFEHGAVDRPYVLGALWNGKDKPPEKNSDGKNNQRTIKSRSGHILRFDDTAGKEKIEIIDKTGKNRVVIDSSGKKIAIESESDLTIESKTGTLTLKAQKVTVESKTSMGVNASTTVEIKSGAQLNLKGAVVNIN